MLSRRQVRAVGLTEIRIATQLYSDDSRIIYELIQNAQDCEFTRAEHEKKQPFLHFIVRSEEVTIDSNEDGFKKKNVVSICKTADSEKRKDVATGGTTYIGEKGIGFKSVFKIAEKVHIQSGPFSFAFRYKHGRRDEKDTKDEDDNVLGMVTPLDERFQELPAGVRTRITLSLSRAITSEEQYDELVRFPDTLMLFLPKIKEIGLVKSFSGTRSAFKYSIDSSASPEVVLAKEVVVKPNVDRSRSEKRYYLQEKTVDPLPEDDARLQPDSPKVVLAFPLDIADHGIVPQLDHDVFAFLPLKKAGFTVRHCLVVLYRLGSDSPLCHRRNIAHRHFERKSPHDIRIAGILLSYYCLPVLDPFGLCASSEQRSCGQYSAKPRTSQKCRGHFLRRRPCFPRPSRQKVASV